MVAFTSRLSHPPCWHAREFATRKSLICRSEADRDQNSLRPVIKINRAPRQAIHLPDEVPVEHSAAYILRQRKYDLNDDEEEDFLSGQHKKEEEPFQGNAIQWYLRKIDKASEDKSKEPSAAARAYYKASSTPLGNTAATGVGSAAQNALKLGSDIGNEAKKAAGPVGKWALKSSFSAAGKLFTPSDKKNEKK